MVLGACCTLGAAGRASAAIRYVDNVGACDGLTPCHATITEAVDASASSDFIEVFPSVYHEAVTFGDAKDHIVLRAHVEGLRPVIAAPSGPAISIAAEGVKVLNFVLEGGGLPLLAAPATGGVGATIRGNLIEGDLFMVGCQSSVLQDNTIHGQLSVSTVAAGCIFSKNLVRGSMVLGISDVAIIHNVVRGNVVEGGSIELDAGRPLDDNTVEENRVSGGGIHLGGVSSASHNAIVGNLVRGGGIALSIFSQTPLGPNVVRGNFVSGSLGDGIVLRDAAGGITTVEDNTSVDNAGCDINDVQTGLGPDKPANTWEGNRFRTKCGFATE